MTHEAREEQRNRDTRGVKKRGPGHKLKLCFFFHRFDDGGAEKTTICLANELAKKGHDVTILVRYDYGPLRERVSEDVTILDMHLPENGKLKKNIRNVRYLRKLMNEGTYDVFAAVLTEMAQVSAIAYFLSNKKIPLVCILHSTVSQENYSFKSIRYRLLRFFDRQYQAVVAVSKAVEQDYLRMTKSSKNHTVTIYNPVVNEELVRLSGEDPDHPWLRKDRTFRTLILAGRLTPEKNHRLMFDALALAREKEDIRLILLGDGPLKEELTSECEKRGLSDVVDFHGYVRNPYCYMRACDAVVMSSFYEGLPTVLIEALACGCRIISVDCPSGPDEILVHGTYGILVEPENPQALCDGILTGLSAESDEEKLTARAQDFTVEGAVEAYETFFYHNMRSTS